MVDAVHANTAHGEIEGKRNIKKKKQERGGGREGDKQKHKIYRDKCILNAISVKHSTLFDTF